PRHRLSGPFLFRGTRAPPQEIPPARAIPLMDLDFWGSTVRLSRQPCPCPDSTRYGPSGGGNGRRFGPWSCLDPCPNCCLGSSSLRGPFFLAAIIGPTPLGLRFMSRPRDACSSACHCRAAIRTTRIPRSSHS